MQRLDGPKWITFLYNHNPFYLISCCLILFGLKSAIEDQNGPILDPWILAALLAGYTAALAVTAVLIVRIGRVWDDARSIFMVLLLLFFSLSASFDPFCIQSPQLAITMLGLGFLFVVLVTEGILWQLQIKFTSRFRWPYYGIIGCSFLFPIAIAIRHLEFPQSDVRWLLALFPFVCASAILLVLPAVWSSRKHVAKNGTPWNWPLYPYSVFVLLVIGICGRICLITFAFDPSPGSGSIFGPYFLIPIVLAVAVVVFEIGRVEKNDSVRLIALICALPVLLMAGDWGMFSSNQEFRNLITSNLGSPVWISVTGLALFYAWASRHGDELSRFFLLTSLLAGALLRTDGTLIQGVADVGLWAIVGLAGIAVWTKHQRCKSHRWMLAACWMMIFVASISSRVGLENYKIYTAVNWLMLTGIVVAFCFKDEFAFQMRMFFAFLLPTIVVGLSLLVWLGPNSIRQHVVPISIYIASVEAVIVFVYLLNRSRIYRTAMILGVSAFPMMLLSRLSIQFDPRFEKLAWFGTVGIGCFLIGAFVSSLKAGLATKLLAELRECYSELQHTLGDSRSSELGG